MGKFFESDEFHSLNITLSNDTVNIRLLNQEIRAGPTRLHQNRNGMPSPLLLLLRCTPPRWRVAVRYHYFRLRKALEHELANIGALIGEGTCAVDIGANFGNFSYGLLRQGLVVHAFEPQEGVAAGLRALAANQSRLLVYNCGLSDGSGEAQLYVPQEGKESINGWASLRPTASDHRQLTIPIRTLDSFGLQDVALVKIDVEGTELAVLRGATETIKASKPTLLIEIEERHIGEQTMLEVFQAIQDLGYAGYFFRNRRLVALNGFCLERDQRAHLERVQRRMPTPSYVNNFIFLPA